MADRVELAFRRAALRLMPEGSSVLAAVSGGADSVALLHLLVRFSKGRPLSLAAAHLDHALRRGSATDRRFVERLCSGLRVECVSERRPVAPLRRKDESPEEAARRVRRGFLLDVARRTGAELVALGHTLDDQAETVLMRLVRGAGPTALTGMAESGPGPFVRPLLAIERQELRAYLGRREIAFREDPSNRSLRFDRNRTRRLALPMLAETLNPKAARHLVEAAERLREDAAYVDDLSRQLYRRIRSRSSGNRVELPARRLAATPPPVARRIVRLALEEVGADPRRIAARHLEAVLGLASGAGGKRIDLPRGVQASRRRDAVVLHRP